MPTTPLARLALAATAASITLLATACGAGPESASASDPTPSEAGTPVSDTPTIDPATKAPAAAVAYVHGGVWHRADGTTVALPRSDYDGAVVWNDRLVVTRFDGEVYSVADVIGPDGEVVDTFPTTGPVAVNEAGTTIAWVDTDGAVMTAWDGGEVALGEVELSAPGETVSHVVDAVVGGPDCHEVADSCWVFVNSGVGEPTTFDSHGVEDNPIPGVVEYNDATEGRLASYVDEIEDAATCGGLYDLAADAREWETCDFLVDRIAPDGRHAIGLPSYFDGLGPTSISVLDARTGEETGRFAPEGGFVASWGWSADGSVVFDTYDGANWHLMAMRPNGALEEIAVQKGNELDSPFAVIDH